MEKIQSCVKTFLVCFENNSQNVTPPTPNLNYGFSQPFHNFSALSFFLYFRSHRVNGIVVVFVVGALLRPERLKVKARNRASSLRFLPSTIIHSEREPRYKCAPKEGGIDSRGDSQNKQAATDIPFLYFCIHQQQGCTDPVESS